MIAKRQKERALVSENRHKERESLGVTGKKTQRERERE